MAPPRKASPTPAEQVDERSAQREKLTADLATAMSETERAYDRLGVAEPTGPNVRGACTVRPLPEGELTILERRQQAEEARALGREHEPFDLIAADEADLVQKIQVNGPRVKALEGAIKTLADEIGPLEVQHRDFFIGLGEQGSREAEAQLDKLLAFIAETKPVVDGMWSAWTRVGIPVKMRRDLLGDGPVNWRRRAGKPVGPAVRRRTGVHSRPVSRPRAQHR